MNHKIKIRTKEIIAISLEKMKSAGKKYYIKRAPINFIGAQNYVTNLVYF
jgi:hypothetical protein